MSELHGCRQLRTKLHRFLRDGLELVVASSVHVEVVLKRRERTAELAHTGTGGKWEPYLMVLPQRLSVGHCEQGDAHLRKEETVVSLCPADLYCGLSRLASYLPAVAVDVILHIYTHSTGALVQDGKLRLVVEQSRHLGPEQTHLKVCSYLGSTAKPPNLHQA